ncbi:NAD-dependent histone deacetylase sir2 [Marasmius crinis-equi]|uniref:2'-phosphotransferase n=1 Tax=Marasmius crinis-equi TaxID=585013 RepID=A0ABR3F8R6_9AGAR
MELGRPQPEGSGRPVSVEHLSPRVLHPQDSKTVATTVDSVNELSRTQTDASNIDLLFLQIRAFLEAAEDVDVEPETIQELIQLLTDKESSGDLPSESLGVFAHENQDGGDDEYDPEKEPQELDISALFTRKDDDTWSKAEIKSMMHDLKEKGSEYFVKHYVVLLGIPVPKLLLAFGINLCAELRDLSGPTMRYFLRVAMFRELRIRERLPQYSTIADAVSLIRNSKRILVLTGAGISVSCGIPDFRSRDGLYASLGQYELDDPQQMFDMNYFRENPSVFYQIYPSNFVPSPCHRFIKLLETNDKLLRNYTQNIDTLEVAAGVQRVIQCHGSFATASCLLCRRRVAGKEIEAEIMGRRVPLCSVCNAPSPPPKQKKSKKSKKKAKGEWDSDVEDESDAPTYPPGIMKPDITFFGEKLSDEFDNSLEQDRHNVDLLLVIGTSLKVAPVADLLFPSLAYLPHSVPQILINKTPISHINPDIVLLGNADDIVIHLSEQLGWELPPPAPAEATPVSSGRLYPPRGTANMKKRASSDIIESEPPRQVGDSHVWLFPGAEGGRWLADLEKQVDRRAREIEGAGSNGAPSAPQTRGSSPTSGSLSRPPQNKPDPLHPHIRHLVHRLSWTLRRNAPTYGLGIRPDGYVRVRDLLRRREFRNLRPSRLIELLQGDPQHRFQFKEEYAHWPGSDRKELLIRHHGRHIIKHVNIANKRVRSAKDIRAAIFCTDMEGWESFRQYGIWSEEASELIRLVQKVPEHYGTEMSKTSTRVLISVDVERALKNHIMFFKTVDGSLVTEGDDQGCISPEFFKDVVALHWETQVLLDTASES